MVILGGWMFLMSEVSLCFTSAERQIILLARQMGPHQPLSE